VRAMSSARSPRRTRNTRQLAPLVRSGIYMRAGDAGKGARCVRSKQTSNEIMIGKSNKRAI